MKDKSVLVAGATGYLGGFLIKEAKRQGYRVRALTRDAEKLSGYNKYIDDLFVGEVTRLDTLVGICKGIDFVVSAVGITRQKDGLTYMDVDYGGNRNLLDCAVKEGVTRFIYVSVFNANLIPDLKIIKAKEKFVSELMSAPLKATVIRPTGFFSDMLEFLEMARKGKVKLFGKGEFKINPIHGRDLAEVCIAAFERKEMEIPVGGPEIYTFKQIAELAFEALNKEVKISYTPLWVKDLILKMMRLLTSSKTYGPVEFIMTALSMDGVAPSYGREKLLDFYKANFRIKAKT